MDAGNTEVRAAEEGELRDWTWARRGVSAHAHEPPVLEDTVTGSPRGRRLAHCASPVGDA